MNHIVYFVLTRTISVLNVYFISLGSRRQLHFVYNYSMWLINWEDYYFKNTLAVTFKQWHAKKINPSLKLNHHVKIVRIPEMHSSLFCMQKVRNVSRALNLKAFSFLVNQPYWRPPFSFSWLYFFLFFSDLCVFFLFWYKSEK